MRAEQVDRLHASGLRRSGSGREARIEHIDVDREVDVIGTVERFRNRVFDHRCHTAIAELAHEMPAHSLSTHPLEHILRRPVAAQTDLHEIASRNRRPIR